MKDSSEIGAYLAAIVESSDDAIISKNLDGTITSWNASAERIFGYKPEEMIGRHISTLIPFDRQKEELEIISRLKQGLRINHFETIRLAKSGKEVELSITVSPIRNAGGTIIGASKVARDISDRKKTEKALKDLSARKDEFLANISHELRTPMNAVVGLAAILAKSTPLTEKQQKFIDTLKVSADNLLALINDLLDFSKLENESVELENIDFDIQSLISKCASMMELKAKEKNIDLRTDSSALISTHYRGDPLRINQIISNLVSNAIKFTEQGSVIIKTTSAPIQGTAKHMLSIEVIDTGIGIPQDKRDLVFEKFTQADASFTRKYGGTGLGLSICKALATQMGGTISLESTPGIGSIFIVKIPLETGDGAGQKHPPQGQHLGLSNDSKTILLVEDYLPNIVVAGAILEQLGYSYDTAQSGTEALKKFQVNAYDIILMDVQMHGIDGIETTRRIRKLEQSMQMQPTPIMAMTAHVHEDNKAACYDAGMNDFIAKPFDPDELKQKIHKLITEKHQKNKS